MQKYDEEYERLMALAAKVDEGRDEVDKGNLDYAEVQKSIKAYNESVEAATAKMEELDGFKEKYNEFDDGKASLNIIKLIENEMNR